MEPQPAALRAQRISFLPEAASGASILRTFDVPRRTYAVSVPVTFAELPQLSQAAPSRDLLLVLFLPSGMASSADAVKQSQEWIGAPLQDTPSSLIEVLVRSDRILWRPGRALICAAPERFDEVLVGVIEFTFYESELRRLETEVAAEWSVAEIDISLTHAVSPRDLRRQPHVNDMTRAALQRRIQFARLEPVLEKGPGALSGPVRRMFSEMAVQSDVPDRLRYVDDAIEVFTELYESANCRLTEFDYARKEFWLEISIIVILIAEVVLMLCGR